MTLKQLFRKYQGLGSAKYSGVEFYQFIDKNGSIKTITSQMDEPSSTFYGGYNYEDGEYEVGNYLLSFPGYARTMIFKSVDEIDAHLTKNGKFKLPGYIYK